MPESTEKNGKGTSNDRLFFALPNFLTIQNAGQVPPLTSGQKFKVVFSKFIRSRAIRLVRIFVGNQPGGR